MLTCIHWRIFVMTSLLLLQLTISTQIYLNEE